MTISAIICYSNMCSGYHIIIVVDREGCGCPVGVCCMTGGTGGRNVDGSMIGIDRSIKIGHVATGTGIGCVYIISLMTCKTIVGNGCVCTSERVYGGMVKG